MSLQLSAFVLQETEAAHDRKTACPGPLGWACSRAAHGFFGAGWCWLVLPKCLHHLIPNDSMNGTVPAMEQIHRFLSHGAAVFLKSGAEAASTAGGEERRFNSVQCKLPQASRFFSFTSRSHFHHSSLPGLDQPIQTPGTIQTPGLHWPPTRCRFMIQDKRLHQLTEEPPASS